jgi:hypothetical protein
MNSKVSPRVESPEKNGDTCGHRIQEVPSLQALTERVTLRFNV